MIEGKQIKNASIDKTKVSFTTPVGASDPAIKSYVDTSVSQALYNQDWKPSCRVASTANVNIASAPATQDGVSLVNGDRVFLKNNTSASENGIRVFTATGSPLLRSVDADGNTEITAGMCVLIEEGTVNAGNTYKLSTPNPILVDTTPLNFTIFSTVTTATPTNSNKYMTASVTVTDGDEACATGISSTPNGNSFVKVSVNGDSPEVGNGVKTKDCYFSGDAGATARSFNTIVAGDKLHWNGSIANYQLAITDKITFEYNV